MGKRSNFKRSKNDLYRTPLEAAIILRRHLPARYRFVGPCAGNGQLSDHLRRMGGTAEALLDINPARGDITQGCAFQWTPPVRTGRPIEYAIENPPWSRPILHQIIRRYSQMYPTWLLFDADWMHTKQSTPYMKYCHKVVSVGRLKWFPNSKQTGKDNCAWYLFDQSHKATTQLIGRAA